MILRRAVLGEVVSLFESEHAYAGVSSSTTYLFALEHDAQILAAFAWQPPPFGAARRVCPEAPYAVLSLSRMAAIPAAQRATLSQAGRHISKPLRTQVKHLIDRTRWPVLVTYSDEGLGHRGHVYRCAGWTPTERSLRPQYADQTGRRTSAYRNGRYSKEGLQRLPDAWIQRWEHWVCPRGDAAAWMERHGWRREPIPGKVWRSGAPAFRFVRQEEACAS